MNSESLMKNVEQEKKVLDGRLVGKHIRTLACLQVTCTENELLKHRVSQLEGYKIKGDYYAALEQQVHSLQNELSKCDHLHSLGRNVEEKITEIKEEYSKALQDYQEDIEERYRRQVTNYISEQKKYTEAWEEEKAKIKRAEEELQESNKILQKKIEVAAVMEKDMDKLVEEFDKTVASFEEIKARNEEMQQSENNLQELCKSLEIENISLQEELEHSSYRTKKLKKEMNKMVMKITKYIKQIKELEKVKNTVSRLEFENTWVKHLHDKGTLELKSLKLKHKDVFNELQLVTQDRNLLRNELSSVQQDVVKLKNELESSKHSFAEFLQLRRQVDILEERNKSLSQKSRTYKMLKPDTMMGSQTQLVPLKLKAR